MHVVLLVRLLGYLKFIPERTFKITVSVISQYVILVFFEKCHTSKYREVILLVIFSIYIKVWINPFESITSFNSLVIVFI